VVVPGKTVTKSAQLMEEVNVTFFKYPKDLRQPSVLEIFSPIQNYMQLKTASATITSQSSSHLRSSSITIRLEISHREAFCVKDMFAVLTRMLKLL
jgi:hypothetical protein